MSSIEALPKEIIEHITLFLDEVGVNCLRITCMKLHKCIPSPFLMINDMKQYENLSKKDLTYLSTLKMDKILLNNQQIEKILCCKKLECLEMSIMCTSEANYDMNFDELQLLKIMSLKFYIKDFGGKLTTKGSPALIRSKVKILGSNCKIHEKIIILDFLNCSNLKS
jgi:hypothetical protein